VIALYGQHFPDKGLTRRPEQARKLAEFLATRAMLRSIVDRARNGLEHLSEPALRAIAETLLADTAAALKRINAAIAKLIADDQAMARKAKLVRSMSGAGPVLAANLLAYVPEWPTSPSWDVSAVDRPRDCAPSLRPIAKAARANADPRSSAGVIS
jgi:alkylation response protein AidB-like acyl-CoA dehydrogenase